MKARLLILMANAALVLGALGPWLKGPQDSWSDNGGW
jgi:hypothetical protein